MYFIFIYENKGMKPVEIVLRRGRGDEVEQWRKLLRYCKHIGKYYNASRIPPYNYYMLIK
jgi:hypothetical protein